MKKLLIFVFTVACLYGLTACNQKNLVDKNVQNMIVGNTYVYEKDGFGGDFIININEDGTFSYYEGALSSYIGMGKWTLEGNTLCLADDEETGDSFVNYFKVDEMI